MSVAPIEYIDSASSEGNSAIRRSLATHAGIGVLVLTHAIAAFLLSFWVETELNLLFLVSFASVAAITIPAAALCVAIFEAASVMLCSGPRKADPREFLKSLRVRLGNRDRVVGGLLAMTLMSLCIGSFSFIKDSIPDISPFGWDRAFFEADRWLFMGIDPWQASFAIFGSPAATAGLDLAYGLWFLVMYGTVIAMAFGRVSQELRYAFLYAFVLAWIVGGNLLAMLLSSAGPVYFSRLGLGGVYDQQFALLNEFAQVQPIRALDIQNDLWSWYLDGSGIASGISAMPSMHVGISVLLAMLAWRINRAIGAVMTIFAMLISIGSVHLGWHYFVDGLLGSVVAVGCWYAGSLLAQIDLRRSIHQK
jgi:hypothetical protein